MKNKDDSWYEQKIQELKKEKKQREEAMRKSAFVTSKDRKQVAEEARKKKRSLKRALKQNLKKMIQNEIDSMDI